MPNENTGVCDCGVPALHKKSDNNGQSSKTRNSNSGSSSSVTEPPNTRSAKNHTKSDRRINSSRRTRSAQRPESHYTYIDSNSSYVSGSRSSVEHAYATIPDLLNTSRNATTINDNHSQSAHDCPQPVYSIPTMTSPPPTYDVAINKSWQTGLPPSYEDYLCHKYAMLSRSHTPPPPWSDSTPSNNHRQDSFVNQTDPHVYADYTYNNTINSKTSRALKTHVKQQKLRAMSPRSLSESRAQQERLRLYQDEAFCMETTAIQSAFEHDLVCNLM
ncbi:uncharacterized protein [Chelonus insularis]|uniref:uncharacterized protein n=1 Tax=Chelonus insularis TaxID=460826 RepID=UPI00158DE81D|nr:uncharacterized protein LOC118068401 [Chelonus insularis]XP_034941663.1 uncharacterized protein LOC118068401 [Chelonus insularis]